jgi:hypothetical protein
LSRESEAITRKTKDQKPKTKETGRGGEGVNGRRGDRETGRLEDKETGGRGDKGNQNPKANNQNQ